MTTNNKKETVEFDVLDIAFLYGVLHTLRKNMRLPEHIETLDRLIQQLQPVYFKYRPQQKKK